MKLKEYIKQLKKLEREIGNVELIYGIDEEGNSFNTVCFAPSIKRVYKKDLDRGSIDGFDVYDYNDTNEEGDTTVVCIN